MTKSKNEKLCFFCNKSLKNRCLLNNIEGPTFILMPDGESAHIECYMHFATTEKAKKMIEDWE